MKVGLTKHLALLTEDRPISRRLRNCLLVVEMKTNRGMTLAQREDLMLVRGEKCLK
jgi:hypothetical protein